MSSVSMLSLSSPLVPSLTSNALKPSASSLAFNTSRKAAKCLCMAAHTSMRSGPGLLHSSPLTSFGSPFLGSSLGSNSSYGISVSKKRGQRLVVKAGKYTLGQTKRHRSRKSLARVHGFRKRMSTNSGRAVLKRRRAKGRWVLCTKTNESSGKRS